MGANFYAFNTICRIPQYQFHHYLTQSLYYHFCLLYQNIYTRDSSQSVMQTLYTVINIDGFICSGFFTWKHFLQLNLFSSSPRKPTSGTTNVSLFFVYFLQKNVIFYYLYPTICHPLIERMHYCCGLFLLLLMLSP